MLTLEEVESRGRDLAIRKGALFSEVQKINKDVMDLEKSIAELTDSADLHQKVLAILNKVNEDVAQNNLRKFENAVNLALGSVFPDMDLSVHFEPSIKRGTTVYTFQILKDGKESSVHGCGGGVLSVISVACKVLCNRIQKTLPLVGFDESLAHISKDYVETCSRFIKTLVDQMGVVFLMVSHTEGFAEHADVCLRVTQHESETFISS